MNSNLCLAICCLNLTLVVAATAARSSEKVHCQTSPSGDISVCVEKDASVGLTSRWKLLYTEKGITEAIVVACQGKELQGWKSYGELTEDKVDFLARKWCSVNGETNSNPLI